MSLFFINRPIFAWVLAIVAMLAGVLSLSNMPISQYPNIAAPAIAIQVNYPGASAQTVQDTVVQVIEQQMSGLDGFRYMAAESNSDGSMQIIVTFEQGVDPDIAQGAGVINQTNHQKEIQLEFNDAQTLALHFFRQTRRGQL